jgi:hypothetical protein
MPIASSILDKYEMEIREIMSLIERANLDALPAHLFHGTSILSGALIVADGKLYANAETDKGPTGLSFTTSEKVAQQFANDDRDHETVLDVLYFLYDSETGDGPVPEVLARGENLGGIIFVVDTAKISARNTIISYHDPVIGDNDEEEVRVQGESISNFLSYVTAIHVSQNGFAWLVNACMAGRKADSEEETPREWLSALKKLQKNSKVVWN